MFNYGTMSFLPPYLLKISITITVVYAIYWLLFRRLTFYTWNRWYLMILSVLSFIIPLADISYLLGNRNTSIAGVYIPSLDQMIESPDSSSYQFFTRSLTWMNGIYFLVATGTFLLLIRLVIQYLSFRKMLRSADVIMEGPVRVYQVHESIVPFSFANSIFESCFLLWIIYIIDFSLPIFLYNRNPLVINIYRRDFIRQNCFYRHCICYYSRCGRNRFLLSSECKQ